MRKLIFIILIGIIPFIINGQVKLRQLELAGGEKYIPYTDANGKQVYTLLSTITDVGNWTILADDTNTELVQNMTITFAGGLGLTSTYVVGTDVLSFALATSELTLDTDPEFDEEIIVLDGIEERLEISDLVPDIFNSGVLSEADVVSLDFLAGLSYNLTGNTVAIDINELTTDAAAEGDEYLMMYDVGAAALEKIDIDNVGGGTDDQNIQGMTFSGGLLTVGIEGGSSDNVSLDGRYSTGSHTTDTNLSQEEVEDYVGGMTSGTETGISVTYNDGTGNLDYVVTGGADDQQLSFSAKSGSNVPLTIQDGNSINITQGSNISLTRNASNQMTIAADDNQTLSFDPGTETLSISGGNNIGTDAVGVSIYNDDGAISGGPRRFNISDSEVQFYDLGETETLTIENPGEPRIGIGTTNPGVTLEIDNSDAEILLNSTDGTLGYSRIFFENSGDNIDEWYIGRRYSGTFTVTRADAGSYTADVMYLDANSPAYSLSVDSDGDVGIGTINAEESMEITGGSETQLLIESTSASQDAGIRLDNSGDDTDEWRIVREDDGRFEIQLNSDGTGTGASRYERIPFLIREDAPDGGFVLSNAGYVYIKGDFVSRKTTSSSGELTGIAFENDADGDYAWFAGREDITNNFTIISDADEFFHTDGDNHTMPFIIEPQAATNSLYIEADGDVGIGKTDPAYALDVVGDINASGNIRDSGTALNVPDYVFEDDYELMPLDDLAAYVKKEKHLPGIPSMEDTNGWGGLSLQDRDMNNLKKIEELLLYIIKLEKRITELENK